jgi:hypothetical protein
MESHAWPTPDELSFELLRQARAALGILYIADDFRSAQESEFT